MEVLHLPDNMKVHFAGVEKIHDFVALNALGCSYSLFTAFPYVERMIFGKSKFPMMRLKWMKNPAFDVPNYICDHSKHVIQDSGLFSLMFGSQKGNRDETLIDRWYDGLVRFTLQHGQPVTCVEVDCQKVAGAAKAWELRERMREDLPNNRIINVFHLEDGWYGLDRMIEFSDYIAIGVPELRVYGLASYVPSLAKYIKRKKPSIDIHLLGCTELPILHACSFCTSCDSTSWTAPKRFGFIGDYKISLLDTNKIKAFFGSNRWEAINKIANEQNTNTLCVSVEYFKRLYEKAIGNQDYYYNNN